MRTNTDISRIARPFPPFVGSSGCIEVVGNGPFHAANFMSLLRRRGAFKDCEFTSLRVTHSNTTNKTRVTLFVACDSVSQALFGDVEAAFKSAIRDIVAGEGKAHGPGMDILWWAAAKKDVIALSIAVDYRDYFTSAMDAMIDFDKIQEAQKLDERIKELTHID